VLDGLAGVAGAAEQDAVRASRPGKGKLVEGHANTTGLGDTCASTISEAECAHSDLGDFQQTDIVSHGTDNNGNLVLLAGHELRQAAQAKRGAVDPAHEEALKDDLVEGRVGPASKEAVQLFVNKTHDESASPHSLQHTGRTSGN
jgi:hypothetical protein